MAHSRFITPPKQGDRYPHCNALHHIGYIPRSTRLYRYGGHVVRVMYAGETFDVISCVRDLCTFCQDYRPYTPKQLMSGEVKDPAGQKDDAEAAEDNPTIDVEGSPFQGLPFVHAGMDCTANKFEPMVPEEGLKMYEVPADTRERWIMFDDSRNKAGEMLGYRKVLTCWPRCDDCTREISK